MAETDHKKYFNVGSSESILTVRDTIAIVAVLLSGAVYAAGLWFSSQGKIDLLNTRADNVEKHVQSIDNEVKQTHDTVIELRSHQRATGEQLNRIETIVRGSPPPFAPKPPP